MHVQAVANRSDAVMTCLFYRQDQGVFSTTPLQHHGKGLSSYSLLRCAMYGNTSVHMSNQMQLLQRYWVAACRESIMPTDSARQQ